MKRVRISPHRFRALVLILAAVFAAGLLAVLAQPKPAEAAFPGKNGEIAFQSSRDGNEEIYVMRADGSNQTRLTTDPPTDPRRDIHPAFSPDGKQLTFTIRNIPTTTSSDEIYLMNVDGTNQTPLAASNSFQSVFSPDATKIAFVSFRDGNNSELYVMDSDGYNPLRLTNTAENETRPVFSPDGKNIAFTRLVSGVGREIYLINLDDGVETRLTNNLVSDNEANFSPDGRTIAFNRSNDIYLMNSDGTNQRRLTSTSHTEELPAFSPDGEHLAFASNQDGNFEIYAMDVTGTDTAPRQLTKTAPPVVNTKPDWGTDTTAPTFSNVPGPLTQEASGPSGAEVTYDEPTATDRVDGSVAVECSPASGSTFPLGTTEVTCTARDKAGNEASESFTVSVKGDEEQLGDLVASVRSLDIQAGTENSLLSKLRGAQDHLEANDQEGACEDLRAFANHARAQSDKKLTQEQATELIEDADRIRAVLGC